MTTQSTLRTLLLLAAGTLSAPAAVAQLDSLDFDYWKAIKPQTTYAKDLRTFDGDYTVELIFLDPTSTTVWDPRSCTRARSTRRSMSSAGPST